MITWGISANSHDAALAVFADKKLVFASHSERFSGIKNDPHLDQNMIDYVRKQWGNPNKVCWYERPVVKSIRQLFAGQGLTFKENNVKRKLEIDAREITQIWGNFKGKVMRESNIKKSTNFIKEILKEETSLQTKMLKLIQDRGLIIASKLTGGINRLASVLKETPETLLTKYLSQETFSTDDIEKNTGGYNFKFKLQFVEKYNDYYDFFIVIEEGTVELIMTDDDTEYNLFGNYIEN